MRQGHQPTYGGGEARPTPPVGGSGVKPADSELRRAARALCDHLDACEHLNTRAQTIDYLATALGLSRRLRRAAE